MFGDNWDRPLPKEAYYNFGCLVCEEDFYSAEYYDPAAHLERLIEDLEWNEDLARRDYYGNKTYRKTDGADVKRPVD